MPTLRPCAIGVDFGTGSARALVLDLVDGEELAVCEVAYPHGVLDKSLPATGERLPPDWALHDPRDYVEVLEASICGALAQVPGSGERVVGIGVDATSCTVLPVTADGVPMCTLPQWRAHPHAWAKLWKHHAAQPVADRLNEVAAERGEQFLSRYGGRISSEWYFPKLIEIWRDDREIYDAMGFFVEVTDWVVWQLCGRLRRSACPAAYKALWSEATGLPSTAYFEAAFPGFSEPGLKLGSAFEPLGARAGTLRPELADKLGLPASVAVAVGNVDSFVSLPGAGVDASNAFVMVVGTSICDLVVHPRQLDVRGITGVARDGIIPGMFGYEAGQPAAGDMLAWFAENIAADHGGSLGAGPGVRLAALEPAAGALGPGETGLVALDWWNGNRSVLADAALSGVIAGLTLQTTAVDIYRCLLESIAFGNRVILDSFGAAGFELDSIVACGGIADKSPLLMQILADVSGRRVSVPASSQVPSRGAALFGAVAAGASAGGFAGAAEAAKALQPGNRAVYSPRPAATAVYDGVYAVFESVHDTFGRNARQGLHELKRLKTGAMLDKRS